MDNNGDMDRRLNNRYKVPTGTFAMLKPHSINLGAVIDISREGMAFHYVKNKKEPGSSSELAVLISKEGVVLDHFPFKVISDIHVSLDDYSDTTLMRRVNVRFGELSNYQEAMLDTFLLNRTLGKV